MDADLTIVVPAYNAADELPRLLADADGRTVIVANDASTDATADVATALGASVVTSGVNSGPAHARNEGWRAATTPFIAFVDADASIPTNWAAVRSVFDAQPNVALVAPRIAPRLSDSPTDTERYDAATSVYDLGETPGEIGPDEPIRYLTSAVVFARREALIAVDGFDPSLRFGEDLDLLLKMRANGWRAVYEPASTATHACRRSLGALLRLHYRYNVPHGLLSRRWKQNRGVGVISDRTFVAAITGPWFVPLVLLAAYAMPYVALAFVLVALLRYGLNWRRFLDTQASAAGLWWGSIKAGTIAPLAPRWPRKRA